MSIVYGFLLLCDCKLNVWRLLAKEDTGLTTHGRVHVGETRLSSIVKVFEGTR